MVDNNNRQERHEEYMRRRSREEDMKTVTITQKEYELFQKLKKVWVHSVPEKSGQYFICGEGGERDEMGLPEYISVCPQYGADGFAYYKKHKEYTAPGY